MNAVTFQTHLNSTIFQVTEASKFIGKDVIISITEVPKEKSLVKRTKKTSPSKEEELKAQAIVSESSLAKEWLSEEDDIWDSVKFKKADNVRKR